MLAGFALLAIVQGAGLVPASPNNPINAVARKPDAATIIDLPRGPPMISAPAGTVVLVSFDQDLSSTTTRIGAPFTATLVEDVVTTGVVIPKGAVAHGVVLFVSGRGGFGRSGIIDLALRTIEVGGRQVALQGRYHETGKEPEAAVATTFFAVGIFSGLIKGGSSTVPRGRVLRARLAEDVTVPAPPRP